MTAVSETGVCVCICTFRRPQALQLLLESLHRQTLHPQRVVVVDNDKLRSAEGVCAAADFGFELIYDHEPEQNISRARNRTLRHAQGDWVGFLDDDEVAPPDWLERMLECAAEHEADGVLAPVISEVPPSAPAWIQRGDFYGRERYATGTVVPNNQLRIGNALIRHSTVASKADPFDPAFGLTGGEDGRLLGQLVGQGARFVWCDEAVVTEPVEAKRLSLNWILMRAMRGGQDFGLHFLAGAYGPVTPVRRVVFAVKALLALLIAAPAAALSFPFGRHRAAHWLKKAYAQLGKLLAFSRYRYQEYRDPAQ